VFIGDVADFPHVLNGHKAGSAAADGENLAAFFRVVYQNARFKNFVVGPLTIVLLDNRREVLPKMPGAKVSEPVFLWILRIIFA